jgi:segregation and condensation protein A
MKILDLEVAGEFIEMVATLMSIKARMLLPKPVFGDDENAEDPRTELVQRLLEYKKFKEAASEMYEYEDYRRKLFSRKYFVKPEGDQPVPNEEYLQNVSLFDLLLAFKKALDNMPKVTYHEVKKIEVTIEEQTAYILDTLEHKSTILFSELIEKFKDRIIIIVTFLALLELIKIRKILVSQSRVFEEITISIV